MLPVPFKDRNDGKSPQIGRGLLVPALSALSVAACVGYITPANPVSDGGSTSTQGTGGDMPSQGTGGPQQGTGGHIASGGGSPSSGSGGALSGSGGNSGSGGATATGSRVGSGGGLGSGGLPGSNSGIALKVAASRTTCSAPCAIFFDATATTGLAASDYWNATWAWTFGDSGNAHNTTKGFTVSHTWEVPGTYVVSTSVKDTSGSTASANVTITVSPMSGTTFYVAASGNDANSCQSMASPCATVKRALSVGSSAGNTIALRKGDDFRGGFSINADGPLNITSYSDPSHASSVTPTVTGVSGQPTLSDVSGTDIRIFDIHLITYPYQGSTGGAVNSVGVSKASSNILFLRVEDQESVPPSGTPSNLQFFIQSSSSNIFFTDCHLHDFEGYGLYAQGPQKISVVGMLMDGKITGQYHGIRFSSCQQSAPGVCSDGDRMGGQQYIADSTIRTTESFDSIAIRGGTDGAVVVDNFVQQEINFTITNSSVVEYMQHILVDGNFITYPTTGGVGVIRLQAKHVAVRNNMLNNPASAIQIIAAPQIAAGWIDDIKVYGNSMYFPSTTKGAVELLTSDVPSGPTFVLRNNILYNAHDSSGGYSARLFTNTGGATIVEDHNLTYSPNNPTFVRPTGVGDVYTDPMFVKLPPMEKADFALQPESPALKLGN